MGVRIIHKMVRKGKAKWGRHGNIAAVVIEPSQSMDILEDPYVILGRKISSFLGFWPLQTYEERFFRSCIVSFSLAYGVLAQSCQIFTLDFNLHSIILVLQLFLPFVSTFSIYYTTKMQFVTFQKLFLMIVQDGLDLKDPIELKIMQDHAYESKLYTSVFGFIFCLYISSSTFPTILQSTLSTKKVEGSIDRYPLFSCVDYFLGLEHYYYPVVIYQTLTVVLTTIVAITMYSSFFWFIQHTCSRLSILKNKLNQPFIQNYHKDNILAIQQNDSNWMIDIIQHLTRTVQFMGLVNKAGQNNYLFQMSMAFLLLVIDLLCLFQIPHLLEYKESREEAFTFLSFICATVLPTYINCYVGQKLMDCSMEVYREACLIPIHAISLKTQKLLLTMLMMNAKPCVISIGKMFVSSHEFFSDLLRMSLSFAMVLHSLQQV